MGNNCNCCDHHLYTSSSKAEYWVSYKHHRHLHLRATTIRIIFTIVVIIAITTIIDEPNFDKTPEHLVNIIPCCHPHHLFCRCQHH